MCKPAGKQCLVWILIIPEQPLGGARSSLCLPISLWKVRAAGAVFELVVFSKLSKLLRGIPQLPWQVVASDLFKWKLTTYLLVIDYFSKFFEIA